MSGLLISAPRKSSGKTTLTLGLSSALIKQGIRLRVFKKGPDYIDPMWHQAVTGLPCYNIDPYWMSPEMCQRIFTMHSREVDFSLVEGNHGLHDGLDLAGSNSGAYLAKLLKLPVILVIDSSGMNRGVAAIVLGHQKLDPDVHIGGVILNYIGNSRQREKQVAAIEHYCDIPVLGAIPKTTHVQIKERHLGLITIHETDLVNEVVSAAAKAVMENCDLDRIKAIAGNICLPDLAPEEHQSCGTPKVKIGVARDRAFCFYYQQNFNALREAGAELVFFDTMADKTLPDVDALYIGGGFPESFLPELEANRPLRGILKAAVESGMPVYAECGGLMYLTRSITRDGQTCEMVGAIPADVEFQKKPIGKGYIEIRTVPGKGWFQAERTIKGHEFHYSRLVNIGPNIAYNFTMERGVGVDGRNDGIVYKNLIAAYSHIHSSVVPEWSEQFVEFILRQKDRSHPDNGYVRFRR
ncbi:hydrogenobyrinic acid a,c-diamide synthase (glutamine-hydrolyzing) [bacterium]|nr:hydrogenobyrinic acid a,c-diamide synthase (glutamine-hydrolyzing) [bacterium]